MCFARRPQMEAFRLALRNCGTTNDEQKNAEFELDT
jgi:hypothetical protein